jgi:hypothetical protein
VHRFVHPQTFLVRPGKQFGQTLALTDHLLRTPHRRERDELRFRRRLESLEEIAQREAVPGITIDQPRRIASGTRSSSACGLRMSSSVYVPGFAHSPSMATDQGFGLNGLELPAISRLSDPNS